MAFCKDDWMKFLNNLGYNVVRLPRSGIAPLELLGLDGRRCEMLGRLDKIWKSKGTIPSLEEGVAAQISGRRTDKIRWSLAAKILEDILSAFGVTLPGVSAGDSGSRVAWFGLSQVTVLRVPLGDLGEYLSRGDLDTDNPVVRAYFLDEGAEAYVITEVLQATAVNLSVEGINRAAAEATLCALPGSSNVKVEINKATENAVELTYVAGTPLTFGFKVCEIGFSEGKWDIGTRAKSSRDMFLAPTSGDDFTLIADGFRLEMRSVH